MSPPKMRQVSNPIWCHALKIQSSLVHRGANRVQDGAREAAEEQDAAVDCQHGGDVVVGEAGVPGAVVTSVPSSSSL